jgi:probable HAF family extracellular repeat protein
MHRISIARPRAGHGSLHSSRYFKRSALALAASLLATGALAGTAAALPAPPNGSGNYTFTTLNDQADPTFNQLLGINDSGLIAGYFGSGQPGHPNNGYRLSPPYGQANYHKENFPGSQQTQVTGLNNTGITVGFYVDGDGNNKGFYYSHGHYHTVNFPTNDPAKPAVDQLLGVNDQGIAVGFFTDGQGTNHGYVYNIRTHRFHLLRTPGDTNSTAAGINNQGDVAGFATNGAGATEAFLKLGNGRMIHLDVPGATATQAFGLNNGDEVVGFYTVGSGSSAQTHGFTWCPGYDFQTVDDPHGVGATTVNGVNDHGDLVGFYTDSAGNTDGMLATPAP